MRGISRAERFLRIPVLTGFSVRDGGSAGFFFRVKPCMKCYVGGRVSDGPCCLAVPSSN